MDQPQKLPPEKIDALAERLQGSLQRRRPRAWLLILAALVVAAGGLGLLAWVLWPQPASPRLQVIAFDDVTAPNETPHVTAQLVFPDDAEYPQRLLQNRELLFFYARGLGQPGQHNPQTTSTTDAHGRAVADWPQPDPDKGDGIVARFIDAQAKQGSNDLATLWRWEPERKILLVDAQESLADAEPAKWTAAFAGTIPARPHAARALQEAHRKQYRIGYLAVNSANPVVYRTVRGWLQGPRTAKEKFPSGPVLGRRDYAAELDADQARRDRLNDLKTRFGNQITLIARSKTAATAGIDAGIRVILLDPDVALPGAVSLAGWAEVIPRLGQ